MFVYGGAYPAYFGGAIPIRALQSFDLTLSSAPCQVFVISLYLHSLGEFTNHGAAFKQNHKANHSELLPLQKNDDE